MTLAVAVPDIMGSNESSSSGSWDHWVAVFSRGTALGASLEVDLMTEAETGVC